VGGVVWGGRTLASAALLLCALLADYSHPADASLATPGNSSFTPPFATPNASDFDLAVGGKPCAGQTRDVDKSAAVQALTLPARRPPVPNQTIDSGSFSKVEASAPSRSAAIFCVTWGDSHDYC
jgi:hypothetical protein